MGVNLVKVIQYFKMYCFRAKQNKAEDRYVKWLYKNTRVTEEK